MGAGESTNQGEDTAIVGAPTGGVPEVGGSTPALAPGRRLGRYLLLDRIGRGGMGEVHLAYDPQLDRRIAIKVLRRNDRLAVSAQRLLREARALAKLNHPNVVAVHDAGTVDPETLERITDGSGAVFVAMEFIAGQTLQRWLEHTRTPREVLTVMQAAGRGLAAAHAAGIVHRDFKPANVMIGEDGRARVVDFGVARRLTGALSDIPVPSLEVSRPGDTGRSHAEVDPTDAGFVVGTPRYMAPEQMSASATDERTDQFSFCVVLYRALYDRAPFPGSNLRELFEAIQTPPKMDGPDAPRIPRRVRDAITRGLSVNPRDRYPSMDALLDQLAAAMRRQRSAWLVAGAGALVIGGVALGSWLSMQEEPCRAAASQFDDAWSDDRRAELVAAFEATGLSFAEDAATRATAALDDYADRWKTAHTDACLATRVRGDQSEALMDLRMTCLDRRRRMAKGLVDVLMRAEPSVVENAVKASRSLPSLAECDDIDQLGRTTPLPDDPEIRHAVEEAFDALGEEHAKQMTGDFQGAAEEALVVLERARDLGAPSLRARAAVDVSSAYDQLGRDGVVDLLLEALEHAAASGDRVTEAMALIGLVQHLGYKQGDVASAERYAQQVRGLISRLPEPDELYMRLAIGEGATYLRAGRYEDAERAIRAGLDLDPGSHAAAVLRLTLLTNLGAAYGMLGRHADAEAITRDELALAEKVLGPHHPTVGTGHLNLGVAVAHRGRDKEAEREYDRALEILTAAFPDGQEQIAMVMSNRAQLYKYEGDNEAARAEYEKALKMKLDLLGEMNDSTAHTANNLADLLLELGDYDGARRYAEMAKKAWEGALGKAHPNLGYVYVTLGEIESAEGHYDKALELMEHARELWSDTGRADAQLDVVRFAIAHLLIKQGKDLERARKLAEESIETARVDPTLSRTKVADVERFLAESPTAQP